jgi:hypothetical protein
MAEKHPVEFPLGEPSVLDFVRARLFFWRGEVIELPPLKDGEASAAVLTRPAPVAGIVERPALNFSWRALPWQTFLLLALMLTAQWFIEPPRREATNAVILYILAAGWVLYLQFKGEFVLAEFKKQIETAQFPLVKLIPFLGGLAAIVAAVFTMQELRFTPLNLSFWLGGLVLLAYAFLEVQLDRGQWWDRFNEFRARQRWHIPVSRWGLVVLAALAVVLYFQTARFDQVTADMGSAQVENLLDVQGILDGDWRIFFPRNRGREPLHLYLTALTAAWLGQGISFASLKIAALIETGLFLFYLFQLGKEIGNRRAGLFALLLAGIAFWPIAMQRIGLRYMLLPLAMAALLFHLIRGLRTASPRHFVLAGVAIGVGVLGFRAAFTLPIIAFLILIIYILHQRTQSGARIVITALVIVLVFGFVLALPLLQFWALTPDEFQLTNPFVFAVPDGTVTPNIPAVLLGNLRNAVLMFNWDNGSFSAFTVSLRPALDVVTGGLFLIGAVLLLGRYVLKRDWRDLTLLLALPITLVPSILRVQVPTENPAPHLAAGALALVFVMAALALEAALSAFSRALEDGAGRGLAFIIGLCLLGVAAFHNQVLIFDLFANQYAERNWNSAEIGSVIENFANTVGERDQAWVLRYPHWVDTRVVGIEAGYAGKDYQIGVEELEQTLDMPTPKMFILNIEDAEGLSALQVMYPNGVFSQQDSIYENRDFTIFFVPAGQ